MKDHRAGLHPFAQVRLMPFSIVGLVASAPYVDLLSLQSITGIADTVSIPMTPTWNSPAEKRAIFILCELAGRCTTFALICRILEQPCTHLYVSPDKCS